LRAGEAQAIFTIFVNIPVASLVKIDGDSQTALTGQAFARSLVVEARNASGAPVAGAAVTFAVTSGSATLSAASAITGSDGRASTNVTAGASPGAVTVSATITGLSSVTFSLTVIPPGPQVTRQDIRNAISGDLGVTPGGIIAIYGSGIAPNVQGTIVANGGFLIGGLPTTLAGVEVLFGTTRAPIYHVNNISGQQWVVVQAPFSLTPGTTTSVTINVGGGSTTVTGVDVKAYQPGIFEMLGSSGERLAILTKEDGTTVSSQNPTQRGARLKMYLAGLGQTTPALSTNSVGVPGQSLLASLVVAVRTTDGGLGGGVRVVSAETMPGAVGVYVVTFDMPTTAQLGSNMTIVVAIANANGSPNMSYIYYSVIPSVQ
jgi:uncharacterized protein (TIGR03437 family)